MKTLIINIEREELIEKLIAASKMNWSGWYYPILVNEEDLKEENFSDFDEEEIFAEFGEWMNNGYIPGYVKVGKINTFVKECDCNSNGLDLNCGGCQQEIEELIEGIVSEIENNWELTNNFKNVVVELK